MSIDMKPLVDALTGLKAQCREPESRLAPLEMIAYGATIEIRPKGEGHWEHVAVVNPSGDSSSGIPCRADRQFAQLIVDAVNAYKPKGA